VAEVDLASWFVSRAVEAYGDRVLARAGESDTAGPQAVGRVLARLIFGRAEAGASVPAPVAIEIGLAGSRDPGVALDAAIEEFLEADPGLSAAVAEVLAGYYRQQLESGDGPNLAKLGDLLWFDEPELARAAFERAVDAGNRRALIRLATHKRVVSGDYEGAVGLYQQAVVSPEPDIVAEALTELGEALRDDGDYQGARAAWERCIATGNPDWAPHAMAMLGSMLESRLGDHDGAQAMLQAAFHTGHPDVAPRAMLWPGLFLEQAGDDDGAQAAFQRAASAAPPGRRGTAMCELADVLKRRGDTTRATAIWRQVIDTETDEGSPEIAFTNLVNHLWDEGDVDGLRAAHQAGTAKNVREAPYALVVIGRVLRDRGDLDGWREAWKQAIDAGSENADDLRDELSPPAEDQDGDEPAGVPAEFDPRNMARTGIAVLEHGLPARTARIMDQTPRGWQRR
jgi:TolA-binding protein